jgi:hypothetical protein
MSSPRMFAAAADEKRRLLRRAFAAAKKKRCNFTLGPACNFPETYNALHQSRRDARVMFHS